MKKLIILMVFLSILFGLNASAATFYTTDQIMNKVYDTTEASLKVNANVTVGSIEVTTSYTNTVFRRFTLTPGVDSGPLFDFGTQVDSWVILNMADTAEIYINFDVPATPADFKIQAGSGIGGNSKVTNIHCISLDAAEVQAIGYHN
ncbi:MAG TPA: hypothetical protein PKI46_00010 [Bacteroidales bacterium]|nr:hypothetical protein [Bacteroidales bacterium]